MEQITRPMATGRSRLVAELTATACALGPAAQTPSRTSAGSSKPRWHCWRIIRLPASGRSPPPPGSRAPPSTATSPVAINSWTPPGATRSTPRPSALRRPPPPRRPPTTLARLASPNCSTGCRRTWSAIRSSPRLAVSLVSPQWRCTWLTSMLAPVPFRGLPGIPGRARRPARGRPGDPARRDRQPAPRRRRAASRQHRRAALPPRTRDRAAARRRCRANHAGQPRPRSRHSGLPGRELHRRDRSKPAAQADQRRR